MLWLAACISGDRINARCEWYGEAPRPLDLTRTEDQRHLTDDAKLAEALGIRHGDATRGIEAIDERRLRREGCTAALNDQIVRLHGVTLDQVASAVQRRDLWLDVVLVFIPVTLLYLLFGRALAERVVRRFMPEDPMVAVVVVLLAAPFVAGLGFLLGEMWSWLVEMIRLHESHLSYRVDRLPWVRHGLAVFLIYIVVFLALAWTRYRKPRATTTEPPP